MQLTEETVVDLIKGQARIEQAVKDLDGRLNSIFPALVAKDKELEKNLGSVERKIWYFGGAGTVIGAIISRWGEKLLGGK